MEQQKRIINDKLKNFIDLNLPSPQSMFIHDSQSIDIVLNYLKVELPVGTPFISPYDCYNGKLIVNRILDTFGLENTSNNYIESLIQGLYNFRGDFTKRFIVIEDSHKLKYFDNLLITLLRLPEIIHSPISIILISDQPYTILRPTNGLCPDPVLVNIPTISSSDLLDYLINNIPNYIPENLVDSYQALCNFIISSTLSLNNQPKDLLKITLKSWPIFIDSWKEFNARPSARDIEMMVINFARTSRPLIQSLNSNLIQSIDLLQSLLPSDLTKSSQLLLIASYLASYNPPKKDLTLLSTISEKTRKRKKVTHSNITNSKPSQRLIGPKNFTFDRLLHIYGSILNLINENSLSNYSRTNLLINHQQFTDNEMGQVHLLQNLNHLTRIKLIQRTCPIDRLDNITFKCAIPYHVASNLSSGFGLKLHEFLWEN